MLSSSDFSLESNVFLSLEENKLFASLSNAFSIKASTKYSLSELFEE